MLAINAKEAMSSKGIVRDLNTSNVF